VKKHGARLLVDDAHALGVIGPGGRGTAHHFGLQDDVDLIGGTFSKSLASIGGWLVGERKVLEYIHHFAPSFMFAASAAPPCVAAAMAAFDLLGEEGWRMDRLRENFTYMRDELTKMGFELGHTQTAVIPIYVRQDLRTLMMWRELLEEHGVYTNPFISPGVPPKSAMLRTSYMATHSREQLDRGVEGIGTIERVDHGRDLRGFAQHVRLFATHGLVCRGGLSEQTESHARRQQARKPRATGARRPALSLDLSGSVLAHIANSSDGSRISAEPQRKSSVETRLATSRKAATSRTATTPKKQRRGNSAEENRRRRKSSRAGSDAPAHGSSSCSAAAVSSESSPGGRLIGGGGIRIVWRSSSSSIECTPVWLTSS
jgi:hypothetical protein